MNPVTFNEPFEKVIEQLKRQTLDGAFPIDALGNDWQKAPLFDYTIQYEHEVELLKSAERNTFANGLEQLNWPFDTLRLCVTETAVPWDKNGVVCGMGKYTNHMIATKRDGKVHVLFQIKSMWDSSHDGKADFFPLPIFVFITDLCQKDQPDEYGFRTAIWAQGRWRSKHELMSNEFSPLSEGALGSFLAFILDSMSPAIHIATVRPDKEGKSVEWTRQRTHYTLISHGHPANIVGLSRGASVKVDRDEEITRMAHNRRAHYRTLRDPRFRFARGKTIFVRATWVGPKEWKEDGSKQIYRILEEAK